MSIIELKFTPITSISSSVSLSGCVATSNLTMSTRMDASAPLLTAVSNRRRHDQWLLIKKYYVPMVALCVACALMVVAGISSKKTSNSFAPAIQREALTLDAPYEEIPGTSTPLMTALTTLYSIHSVIILL